MSPRSVLMRRPEVVASVRRRARTAAPPLDVVYVEVDDDDIPDDDAAISHLGIFLDELPTTKTARKPCRMCGRDLERVEVVEQYQCGVARFCSKSCYRLFCDSFGFTL